MPWLAETAKKGPVMQESSTLDVTVLFAIEGHAGRPTGEDGERR